MEYIPKIDDLNGTQKEIAEIIGIDAYIKLIKHYGGEVIYIGKDEKIVNAERNDKIIKKFNGKNYHQLHKEFGLSERAIRKIINDYAELLQQKNQLSFF